MLYNSKSAIKFKDLTYTVDEGIFKKSSKKILKGISGKFNQCELTGIIGLSGCGKSSLLNILSGYVSGGDVTGSLEVKNNGKKCFIMQEENLHALLSVEESMMFAIHWKTAGRRLTLQQKKEKVGIILANLGLDTKSQTSVARLSGGQQRRLSIAQELVDNPTTIFLDEPTTGLDSSSSAQCIELLKKLARQGKTVICTIHTPSALVFQTFDQIFAMASGQCIYSGSSLNLVNFLRDIELECPNSYNPSDFLLEIAGGDYGTQQIDRLVKKIKNGTNDTYREAKDNCQQISDFYTTDGDKDSDKEKKTSILPSTSFFNQVHHLMARNFLLSYRDITNIFVRVFIHAFVAILVGLLFFGVGTKASLMLSSFKLNYGVTLFLTYTGFYSMFTKFTLEEATVKRERFNRWYSTSSYYIAMTLSDIPFLLFNTFILTSIIYFMSAQPTDNDRYLTFFAVQTLLSFVAQGFGMMIGSIFQLMGSLFFAAAFLPVIALFGGFMITQKDANSIFDWVFDLNFVKQAGDASLSTVLGYNRSKLECDDALYCHFSRPSKLLETVGIGDQITDASIINLIIMLIVFRIIAYIMIKYRLKS